MKLIVLAMTISTFLAVLTVGMRMVPGDLLFVVRKPRRLLRCLLAMNVLAPFFTIIVCRQVSLHPAMVVALVTLSVAPVGALFSSGMLTLVDNPAFARGLLFASTALS